jgi:hypothetical protein
MVKRRTMMATVDPHADLIVAINEIARRPAGVDVIRAGSTTPDSAAIALVREGAARYIVQISPVGYPNIVATACERARTFAVAVGPSLARAIVLPITEGVYDGRSFACFPFHPAFRHDRWTWWYLRSRTSAALLDWLEDIARLRQPAGDAGDGYHQSLSALAAVAGMDKEIRSAAMAAADRLDKGDAIPCHVPMHGDLWRGNILKPASTGLQPFAIIDWGGSRVEGYPIFDLVRMALSYKLPLAQLRHALRRHAALMQCDERNVDVHLLAALGHYARDCGEMALPVFVAMSRACFNLYRKTRE